MAGIAIDIDVPGEYTAMPLQDIEQAVERAGTFGESLETADAEAFTAEIVQRAMVLGELAKRGVRYCGMAMYLLDGELIVTWLTVWVYDAAGDKENPRAILLALTDDDPDCAAGAEIALLDFEGTPMMLREQVVVMPVAEIPGRSGPDETAAVYQLRATVSADDGSALAAVELSTAFVSYGPHFRREVMDIARSITFSKDLDSVSPEAGHSARPNL